MRIVVTAFLLAGLAAPVLGAECALRNAHYEQNGSDWTLAFHKVPFDAPSNQTAAFTLNLRKSGVALEGGVYQPNGYSSSLGSLSGPCDPQGLADKAQEQCRPWEAVVYAGTEEGIAVLAMDDTTPAPRQILLPQLGSALWYSAYRAEFMEADPGDVFTLAGCGG